MGESVFEVWLLGVVVGLPIEYDGTGAGSAQRDDLGVVGEGGFGSSPIPGVVVEV